MLAKGQLVAIHRFLFHTACPYLSTFAYVVAEASQVLEAALEVVLGPLLAEVLGHLLREFPQLHNAVLQAVQVTLHILGRNERIGVYISFNS